MTDVSYVSIRLDAKHVILFSEFNVKAFSSEWLLPVLASSDAGVKAERVRWKQMSLSTSRLSACWFISNAGVKVLYFLTKGAGFIKRSGASTSDIVPKNTKLLDGSSSHQQLLHVLFYFLPLIKQSSAAPPSYLKRWWNNPTSHQKLCVPFDNSLSWACFTDRRCDINFSEISFCLQLRKTRFIIIQTNLQENGGDFNDP